MQTIAQKSFQIRPALEKDLPMMLALLAEQIKETTNVFDFTPPSLEVFTQRYHSRINKYPHWVCETEEGKFIGFVAAFPFRERDAYQWSVETSIYLNADARATGIGKKIYQHLLWGLAQQGFTQAVACITTENLVSINFHRKVGFTHVGTFPSMGLKMGRWLDITFYQYDLRPLGNYPNLVETGTYLELPPIIPFQQWLETIPSSTFTVA